MSWATAVTSASALMEMAGVAQQTKRIEPHHPAVMYPSLKAKRRYRDSRGRQEPEARVPDFKLRSDLQLGN